MLGSFLEGLAGGQEQKQQMDKQQALLDALYGRAKNLAGETKQPARPMDPLAQLTNPVG